MRSTRLLFKTKQKSKFLFSMCKHGNIGNVNLGVKQHKKETMGTSEKKTEEIHYFRMDKRCELH